MHDIHINHTKLPKATDGQILFQLFLVKNYVDSLVDKIYRVG